VITSRATGGTGATGAAPAVPTPAAGTRPQPGRPAPIIGTVVVALALFTCYLRQSRTISVGSDGASQALQAWDMLHGNPLLHGWWVTDVSFYSTELPQYMLLELVRGLSPDVVHVGGAMTYTLLVLAAAFLAKGRATGKVGLVRALIAGGIMLAPQLGAGTQTLVLSPDHTGTGVPVLLLWLLIDRAPARWYVPVLVGLGLSLTALADALTLFIAVVPLALVCALRLLRHVVRYREPLREHWFELALLAAAVLAVPAELAATALIRAQGGWRVNGLSTALAGLGQLPGNARLAGEGLLELSGADIFGPDVFGTGVFGTAGTGSRLAVALAVVHLAGVALAAAALFGAARRFLRQPGTVELIESLLLTGIVIDLAGYLAGVQAVDISSTREIAPVLPFAAVLAGRLLGDGLLGDGLLGRRLLAVRAVMRYALVGLLALYVAMLGYAAAQPPAPPQYADLAAWLPAHHLTTGLSGYHQANIVTLESGGAVTLRPVTAAGARLIAYTWNASTAWFDPARQPATPMATFLVLTGSKRPGSAARPGAPIAGGPTAARAVATFGRPARIYRYRGYLILVWPRGENLLARLR
jgi:hypothetical protein